MELKDFAYGAYEQIVENLFEDAGYNRDWLEPYDNYLRFFSTVTTGLAGKIADEFCRHYFDKTKPDLEEQLLPLKELLLANSENGIVPEEKWNRISPEFLERLESAVCNLCRRASLTDFGNAWRCKYGTDTTDFGHVIERVCEGENADRFCLLSFQAWKKLKELRHFGHEVQQWTERIWNNEQLHIRAEAELYLNSEDVKEKVCSEFLREQDMIRRE